VAPSTRIADLFEPSSPLAERLESEAPFDSDEELIERARELVGTLSEADKIATLNAHPRIGERADRMSAASVREQGGDRVPELDALNDEYERKFGFRFVVFVNRRPKSEIAGVLRDRLQNGREEEMQTGLDAIVAIAADRLSTR
jgi:2-oxo-4-hydroxy-4-carboxy--5-ureidoimidazoline (OHCU) decarboxylase